MRILSHFLAWLARQRPSGHTDLFSLMNMKARDLEQMIWTGGRVRTKAEFERLLQTVGLELHRIMYTRVVDASLIVAGKARR